MKTKPFTLTSENNVVAEIKIDDKGFMVETDFPGELEVEYSQSTGGKIRDSFNKFIKSSEGNTYFMLPEHAKLYSNAKLFFVGKSQKEVKVTITLLFYHWTEETTA